MTPCNFNDWFDGTMAINRASRTDRWNHLESNFFQNGVGTPDRFLAHEGILVDGIPNGNAGCTASHRGVLELICAANFTDPSWTKFLVLEDDAHIISPGEFEWDHCKNRMKFQDQWLKMMPEIPDDWDMLFLGASYAEPPIRRVSEHIIKCGRMMTTSSYAITAKFARKICPHIYGVGPIDSLMSGFYRDANVYCFTPRLMVQYTNMSDLCDREMNNSMSMLDPNHEAMVPWIPK